MKMTMKTLRKWVKVAMLIIIFVIVASLIKVADNEYKQAVDQCMMAGNSQYFCENGLK